jgi:hypothetical protein
MEKEFLENNLHFDNDFINEQKLDVLGVKPSNISPGIYIATENGTIFVADNQVKWSVDENDKEVEAYFKLETSSIDCMVYSVTISGSERKLFTTMKGAGYTTI